MRPRRFVASILAGSIACSAALSSTSCTSAPPPNTTPTAVASASNGPVDDGPKGPDLSPVEAPKNQVVMLHAKSLSSTMAKLGVDTDLVVKQILGRVANKGGLRLDVPAEKLASQIATEAPVDALVTLPEGKGFEPYIAVAIGLKNLEDAKAAFGATQEMQSGMWLFGGEKAKVTCVVAASNSLVPARIICGPGERDLEALGPYLARGASSIVATSDIALDLDFRIVNEKFGPMLASKINFAPAFLKSQIGIADPALNKVLDTVGLALGNEVVAILGDLEKLHADLAVSQADGITLAGALSFKDKKSWFASTGAKSTNEPAPASFTRLPGDVSEASYTRLNDPADWEAIKKALKDGLESFLAASKVGTDAERKKVASLIDFPLAPNLTFVSGSGTRHVSKALPRKTDDEKMIAANDSQFGYRVYGFGEKSDAIVKWLKDAVAAYNQPGIQKELQKASTNLPLVKTPTPPASLGKGAFELDVEFKFGKDKKQGLTFYALVMADGDDTWLAIGANKDELVARLEMVKTGAPAEKTLAQKKGFDPSAKHSMAGFWTLESFRALGLTVLTNLMGGANGADSMLEASDNLDQLFASLPNKGASPIQYAVTVKTTTPLVNDFVINIPKGTIVDAKSLVEHGPQATPAGQPVPPPPVTATPVPPPTVTAKPAPAPKP